MAVLGRLLSRRVTVSALHRSPIVVKQTATAGRGVFATREIAQGEFIHSAEPIVAHPKLDHVSKVCYYCLRARARQLSPNTVGRSKESFGSSVLSSSAPEAEWNIIRADREASHFCSPSCAASAERFFNIERKADWSELQHYCSSGKCEGRGSPSVIEALLTFRLWKLEADYRFHDFQPNLIKEYSLKFPLVARRLACMVIGGAASADALEILSYPSFPDGTSLQWTEERALLLRTFKKAGVQSNILEFLSEEWYAGVIARLHINAFAIEMIDTVSDVDLFDAAASSISGEGSVGTAVYALPSMYNHDCDPNVNVQWPRNASVRLDARQMIKAGEELRITYVDASLAYHARQEILSEAYGFLCECPRCRDRD